MTSSYRALVVDDEPVAREATVLALQDEGFKCEWARDGEEAVIALNRSVFDVVLTDLKMPHRNGHALAVELLQKVERPVIIVLTGVHEPRLAQDLMRRGVDDFMLKPVDFDLLTHKVKGLIERRRSGPRVPVVPVGEPLCGPESINNCDENRQIEGGEHKRVVRPGTPSKDRSKKWR